MKGKSRKKKSGQSVEKESLKEQSDVNIEYLDSFMSSYEKLKKDYPNLADDINPYIERFRKKEFLGDRDSDFKYPVHKLRIPNRDSKRGLSGGFRLIYLKKGIDFVLLMLLYSKSDQGDVSPGQVKILERALRGYYKARNWVFK